MALPSAPMPIATPAATAAVEPAPVRTPAVAPTVSKPGAGLPARLIALLCNEKGPFLANEVFSATPSEPLQPIEEEVPAPEWYAITRGRFVGVVNQ
jgi:hypothetical protein